MRPSEWIWNILNATKSICLNHLLLLRCLTLSTPRMNSKIFRKSSQTRSQCLTASINGSASSRMQKGNVIVFYSLVIPNSLSETSTTHHWCDLWSIFQPQLHIEFVQKTHSNGRRHHSLHIFPFKIVECGYTSSDINFIAQIFWCYDCIFRFHFSKRIKISQYRSETMKIIAHKHHFKINFFEIKLENKFI